MKKLIIFVFSVVLLGSCTKPNPIEDGVSFTYENSPIVEWANNITNGCYAVHLQLTNLSKGSAVFDEEANWYQDGTGGFLFQHGPDFVFQNPRVWPPNSFSRTTPKLMYESGDTIMIQYNQWGTNQIAPQNSGYCPTITANIGDNEYQIRSVENFGCSPAYTYWVVPTFD